MSESWSKRFFVWNYKTTMALGLLIVVGSSTGTVSTELGKTVGWLVIIVAFIYGMIKRKPQKNKQPGEKDEAAST